MKPLIRFFIMFILLALSTSSFAAPWIQGIYITQPTAENVKLLQSLITQSKAVGINSFVIDVSRFSRQYNKNIQLVESNGITYVARIVMFPHGGSHAQITDDQEWTKKLNLAEYAISLGAKEIQLDYIRYHTKQPASSENALNINRIISWFKAQLAMLGIPLQIAVFGETSFAPSKNIGQDVRLFAGNIDVLAPMLYPSHFEPYLYYSNRPFLTVYDALQALYKQFDGSMPFRVYAYIEVSNYRYSMSPLQHIDYIRDQIKAVKDSKINGWYAWSAKNKYGYLFQAMKS